MIIIDFGDDNNIVFFKFKLKITGQRDGDGTKNVEIMVPLKYLRNFLETLEMPLINCEINFILLWSVNCVTSSNNNADQATTLVN